MAVGVIATTSLAAAEDVQVTYSVTSAWDTGHNGAILIENVGDKPIQDWELRFSGGPDISSLWNGAWSFDGSFHLITNLDWNGEIPVNGSVELGYGANGSFISNIADCTVNGEPALVLYGDGTGGGDGDGDGGGGGDGGGDGDGDGGGDGGGDGDGDGGGDGNGDGNGDGGGNNDPTNPCPADLNGDQVVDGSDLGVMLAEWGGPGSADFNGDGVVDGADLGVMLSAWGACPEPGNKRVVAYYIEWGIYGRDYQPADMPLDKITHVNYAFANISPDGRIAIGDPYAAVEKLYPGDSWDQSYAGTYNQLNNVLRAQYPHIKTLISVGGWTWSGRFSDVALTEQSRSIFAESCVDFIRTYNFDGVDIDWEYPVAGGLPSNTYRPEDGVNYTLLLQELRSQLEVAGAEDGREYLLTIASPAGFDKLQYLELDALGEVLDFINVMTYDLRGAWDLSIATHHAPIHANSADPGNAEIVQKYNIDWVVDEMIQQGVPSDKLVLGIPFYSRSWGGVSDPLGNGGLHQPGSSVPPGTWDDWSSGATGINDFFEIESMLATGGYTRYWDDVAKAPYAYHPTNHGGHFISYEDEESLGLKIDLVEANDLGGVMFWEVTADRNETLMNVIAAGLLQGTP